jgi:spore germination cell wall hydrolase CwlJ-like protein
MLLETMFGKIRWRRMTAWAALASAAWATPAAATPPQATYGQQVVAAVLMAEAWGEGEAAMTAVAEVIRRRADAAGRSPLWVVQQPFQFSCLNRVEPPKLIRKFMRHSDFTLALAIARRVYNRPEELTWIAQGATHFERVGTRAYWTRGHQPVARFGKLHFYRLPDAAKGG